MVSLYKRAAVLCGIRAEVQGIVLTYRQTANCRLRLKKQLSIEYQAWSIASTCVEV